MAVSSRMILSLALVFFTSVAGIFCTSDECLETAHRECAGISDVEDFPETVEELKTICQNSESFVRCMLRVYERCFYDETDSGNKKEILTLRRDLMFIEEACEENSPIFKAISSDLKCIADTINATYDVCAWRNIDKTNQEKIISVIGEYPSTCKMSAWALFCINAKFDVECGQEIRDAVKTIMLNFNYITDDEYCVTDVFPQLSYLEGSFKSAFTKGITREKAVEEVIDAIEERSSETL